MYGWEKLKSTQMIQQNQLPTKIRVSEAWVTVLCNPGMIAQGHFLIQHSSSTKYHGRDT